MTERIVHRWNRKPSKTSFKTVCGIGILAIVKAEVAADISNPPLPRGARWCLRCVPDKEEK